MSLRVYNRKRKFDQTPEPKGIKERGKGGLRFVVQMHDATRLHFDLRLEFDGVFKSWAVPKGPSLNPLDQRLAVFVEDHPIKYGSFEGIIPKGNYGAGTVMIWDQGTYVERGSKGRADSERAMMNNFAKGHLTFVLNGEKLKGEFALIKLKKANEGEKAWLLVKKRDQYSTYKRTEIPDNLSVKTGRTLEQIAEESLAAGDVWLSKKGLATKADLKKLKEKQPVKRAVGKATGPRTGRLLPAKQAKKSIDILSARADKMERTRNRIATGPRTSRLLPAKQTKKSTDVLSARADKSQRPGHLAATGPTPMPRKNKPMLATLSHKQAPAGWIVEPMPEGVRSIAEVEGKRVHLYSKALLPFEKKFPAIVDALKELDVTAVFDGEIAGGKYYVFDLLFLNDEDLRHQPLSRRKAKLEGAFQESTLIKLIDSFKGKTAQVAVKNPESVYKSGTSADWILINATAEVAAEKSTRPRHTQKATFRPLKNSVAPKPKLKPTAVTAFTDSEPRLTNLDKIYFPKDGYTKGDVIEYYRGIASHILPYLKDRPESMNRHPNGIDQAGFYQKDLTGHIPRFIKTHRVYSQSGGRSIDYLLCQDERSLLYMANLGCIEINPWFSRYQSPEKPDFLVIDLDPDDNKFSDVIDIAHQVHEVLETVGAPAFVKTSGATGIHIGVPTGAKYTYDEVREFAEMVCRYVGRNNPALTSVERNPNRRRKKIYLDFMQNRRGQTLAAPLCIRPRDGAPVSMPLTWRELKSPLKPEQFNIQNALRRIQKLKDPWRGVLGSPLPLAKCIKKFEQNFSKD